MNAAIREDLKMTHKNFIQVGQGSFATVWKARDLQSRQLVAIKQFDLLELQDGVYDYIQTEVDIMARSQNINIVKLHRSFENERYKYIIMEYCTTDLEKLWSDYFQKEIPEKYTLCIVKQIVSALAYLHKNFIIHRDIKLENILVMLTDEQINQLKKKNYDVIYHAIFKIGDLGLAKILSQRDQLTSTFAGSPMTMAPEVLEQKDYGLKADMYSLGVITFQMLFGKYPYYATSDETQEQAIKKQDATFNLNNIQITEDLQNLLKNMLKHDVDERLDWVELYNHKFFRQDPLNQISLQDFQYRKNKNIYTNINSIIDQPEQNQDYLMNIELKLNQAEQESTVIEIFLQVQPENEAYDEQEPEVLDIINPCIVFMKRLINLRNQYILINRASVSVAEAQKNFDLNQNILQKASFLHDVSYQLYSKFFKAVTEKQNILKISQSSWYVLIQSEHYQDLVDLVSKSDQQIFTQVSPKLTDSKIKNLFSYFLPLTYFTDSSANQCIDSKGFPQYYQNQLKQILNILNKLNFSPSSILQQNSIKLCLIQTMIIWSLLSHEGQSNLDERQYDLELEMDSNNSIQLDHRLQTLLMKHNLKL